MNCFVKLWNISWPSVSAWRKLYDLIQLAFLQYLLLLLLEYFPQAEQLSIYSHYIVQKCWKWISSPHTTCPIILQDMVTSPNWCQLGNILPILLCTLGRIILLSCIIHSKRKLSMWMEKKQQCPSAQSRWENQRFGVSNKADLPYSLGRATVTRKKEHNQK